MADGRIVIDVVVNDGDFKKLNSSLGNVEKATDSVTGSAKNMTIAFLAAKGVSKIIDTISSSLDSAISRFDTMRQYPKVMELVGFSASQSERSVKKLTDGIQGLPTRLDEVVGTAQSLTMITGDINKATDLTLALNNAFLASGASGMDAARGLQQYQQMLANGKPDMQSWKTLQETMPVALKMTAEAFKYTGTSAVRDFYAALQDGEITFEQFGDKLIELSNQQGGFAEMALESSKGIATSMQNIKTAVINGLTMVLDAIDNVSREITGKSIAENLDKFKEVVKTAFRAIADGIEKATPIIKVFYDVLSKLINFIANNTWVLEGAVAAFLAFKIATQVSGWITGLTATVKLLKTAMLAANDGTGTFLSTLANSGGAIGTFASAIGSVPGIIAVAVGAMVAAVSADNKKREARLAELAAEDKAAIDLLTESISTLSDETAEASENFVTQKTKLDANTDSMKDLADETFELIRSQKRTAGETKQLKLNINELNKALGEEILYYDEKTNAINATSDELKSYIDVMAAENKYMLEKDNYKRIEESLAVATKKRTEAGIAYNNLSKESVEIQSKLNEIELSTLTYWEQGYSEQQKLKYALLETLEAKKMNMEVAQETYEQAIAIEEGLIYEKTKSTNAQKTLIESLGEAENAYMEQLQANTEIRISSLDQLWDADRKYVEGLRGHYQEIKDASTDMFNQIELETDLTVETMLENLQHNIKAVDDWATNLDILADRGLNKGMLDKMRNMGPQGAAYVAELVTMSKPELEQFNEIFETAGDDAVRSFVKAMGIAETDVPEGVMELITATDQGLTDGFNNIDWGKYAQTMVGSMSTEIENKIPDIKDSTGKVADEAVKTITDNWEMHSPSRKAMRIGSGFVGGLAGGIKNAQKAAIEAVRGMTREIASVLQTNISNMVYLGQATGQGFNNGLRSMTGTIIGTANSIANSVSSTIRRALSIRSPSKVTEQLGSYTGEGFAIGMESWLDKINAIAGMFGASFLPKYSASGAVGMGLASHTVNNRTSTDNSMTLYVDKIIWTGEKDIRQTMDEIGFIAGQEKWRLQHV